MKILAIETATEACSAALYADGALSAKYQIAPRKHSELILTMIDELLSDSGYSLSQLDALAFGRGPGAFTGVRIASSVIQGLALSTDRPVIAISTLAILAQSIILQQKQIACAIDARMGEVYWALYQANDNNIMRLVGTEKVCPPNAIEYPNAQGAWFGVGSGWESYAEILQHTMGKTLTGFRVGDYPSAEASCSLAVDAYQRGEILDASQAVPIYLRNNVTT